ncbi:tripartite motif-containing protein 5-like [Ictidomys tridecemlineatus]|nr:tripartite motif-containing protein 5-like [Ictidomys tridecemlineatus]
MASAILGNVKEEVTCPICLDLPTKPLSLDCGHSFCQACITSNYESMMSQKGESSCPVCQISYQFENLRPNRQLANIVERLRGVKLNPEEEQKVYHCARHGEKLLLFCNEDKTVICWLCERSQEHRGHSTFLLEEVVQEYQVRDQNLMLRKPKTFPKEQRRVFRAPDLKGMMQVSQELTDVQRYWVRLTLSPSNNPNIVISKDQRQLRYVTQYSRKRGNYHEGVLGYPPITSGKHYWMVDVSKKSAWSLGLCDGKYFESASVPGQSKNYQPTCGYWVIGLHRFLYNAFCKNGAHYPLNLVLSLTVPPQHIGVFLDYETRELSFYNVTNHGFLIHKFSKCFFPKEVFPYFNPETCPEPMTLHWPSS